MARRRKRNPGVGTLVGLAILGVGGYVVYDQLIKDKKKTTGSSWPPAYNPNMTYAIGKDCMRIIRENVTEAEQTKAVNVFISTIESIGGHARIDPNNPDGFEFDLLDVLGPPPGQPENNVDFVQAWATAVFKKTVHPTCLKALGLSKNYAKETNGFGADFTEAPGNEWPPDVLQYLEELVIGLSLLMQLFGQYEMGLDPMAQPLVAHPARLILG